MGQGASRGRDRLAARLADGLATAGFELVTRVFARPAARGAGLEAQVELLLPWDPDAAVMVIGANDLTHRVPPAAAAGALGAAVTRLRSVTEVVVAPVQT